MAPRTDYCDIIKAFDLIVRQLGDEVDNYEKEIEWLSVEHILVHGIARIIEQKGICLSEIKILQSYVNSHYPE